MRSFRRLGASWLARGVALSLITSSIALGPAHPAAAATGDPFRFIYDQDGRLRAAVTPTDSAKWTYDAVGNITAISRQAATTLSVIRVRLAGSSLSAEMRPSCSTQPVM